MMSDNITLKRFEIEGKNLGYSTEFRDGCLAAGIFVVRSASAQELIADGGFEVLEIALGRGLLALTGVHDAEIEMWKFPKTSADRDRIQLPCETSSMSRRASSSWPESR